MSERELGTRATDGAKHQFITTSIFEILDILKMEKRKNLKDPSIRYSLESTAMSTRIKYNSVARRTL
jgi:hypothetical protein